jgi:hypothetical protein
VPLRKGESPGFYGIPSTSTLRFSFAPPARPRPYGPLERNQAMAEEHSRVDGEHTETEVPGGANFTHPHYEDSTERLREWWHELKET